MAAHNELGQLGEREALFYLMEAGYTLHDHNWRDGHLELDIVAEWWGEIVFVEVKTRSDEHFAQALEAVDLRKKRNLIKAARAWLGAHNMAWRPYRFDIITLVGRDAPFEITHYKNAYTETGVSNERRGRRRDAFEV